MKIDKTLKKVFVMTSILVSAYLLVSLDCLFLYSQQGGAYVILIELAILAVGLFSLIKNHKNGLFLVGLFASYVITSIWTFILFFSTKTLGDGGLYSFAPTLLLVQYLFFLPAFSIPLFNLTVAGKTDALKWRNNYKIVVVLIYLVLLPAVYFFFSG